MKAKKKPIDTRPLSETGTDAGEAMVKTISLTLPPERKGGRIIDGESAAQKAAALVKVLKEEAKVI